MSGPARERPAGCAPCRTQHARQHHFAEQKQSEAGKRRRNLTPSNLGLREVVRHSTSLNFIGLKMSQIRVIAPSHIGYEEARVSRIFNLRRPSKTPAGITFPEDEQMVIDAVKFAYSQGKKISIRSGEHSWAAWSLRDDCMLIDTSRLNIAKLDVEARLATVSPSMTGGQLNEFLTNCGSGLSFLGGHCPDVGLGGFLLQGGQGWGCRHLGWAAEQIESFRVVLPPSAKNSHTIKVVECSRTQKQTSSGQRVAVDQASLV